MATMNIYLPDALKTAMDEVPAPAPNWSGICQKCIQAEIDRLKAAQGDMEALVARVKAAGSSQYDQGYQDGLEFARESADVDDFELFAVEYPELMEIQNRNGCFKNAYALLETLTESIGGDPENYLGDRKSLSWRYLEGFAKAMQDTYRSIEARLGEVQGAAS